MKLRRLSMKYLIKVALLTITNCIVIFLVVTKCTDKKQITEPIVVEPKYNTNDILILDAFNHDIITRMPQNSISTNPIFLDTNTNLVLSYGLTPELYILDNYTYPIQRYGYKIECTWDQTNGIQDGTISNNTYYITLCDGTMIYKAIYYNPENSEYYHVLDMEIISNLNIPIIHFNTNLIEPIYLTTDSITNATNIIYIADLSTNQRLFYKPDNNSYLIKTLNKIIDNEVFYINYDNDPPGTNLAISETVYPALDEWGYLTYTNNKGIHFERSISSDASLATSDTNIIEMLDDNED